MKIGIFSDVHGHLSELHKTLDLFEHLAVDHLLCCGDLVDKGKESDAVVSLMRERAIPCIQGNHDFKAQFTFFTSHEMLSNKTIDYLSKLPPTLSFCWEGDFRFCLPCQSLARFVSLCFSRTSESLISRSHKSNGCQNHYYGTHTSSHASRN